MPQTPPEPADDGSITRLLGSLEGRDEAAAAAIWERFNARVLGLARRRMGGPSSGITEDEDVALSVFGALFRGVEEGRFDRLDDRQDLWRILATITTRKCTDALRRDGRRPEEGLLEEPGHEPARPAEIAEHLEVPDEDFLTVLSATSAEFLGLLEPKLQRVALLRLEGRDNAEVATLTERSLATVERYLAMIRLRWKERYPAA